MYWAYMITVALLLAGEMILKSRLLRVLLVVILSSSLVVSLNTGPAMRRAIGQDTRIEWPIGRTPPRLASEFESGVLVMFREVKADLRGTLFPIAALVWLALVPAFRVRQAGRAIGAGKEGP